MTAPRLIGVVIGAATIGIAVWSIVLDVPEAAGLSVLASAAWLAWAFSGDRG